MVNVAEKVVVDEKIERIEKNEKKVSEKNEKIDIKNISLNKEMLEYLLKDYEFTATEYIEENESVTLSLDAIDLAENGKDEADAKLILADAILEYSEDYLNDFDEWFNSMNRKEHLPYVIKAVLCGDVRKIKGMIICHRGEHTDKDL